MDLGLVRRATVEDLIRHEDVGQTVEDVRFGGRFLLRLKHAAHVELEVGEWRALNDSVRDARETILTFAVARQLHTTPEPLRRQGYTRLLASVGAWAAEVERQIRL